MLTTLVTFNGSNGGNPMGALIGDSTGNLYGTASTGGTSNDGTVFELAAGTYATTILANCSYALGTTPEGTLLLDSSGNLFGTTWGYNGLGGQGALFEIPASTRTLSDVVALTSATGTAPAGNLIMYRGNIFGTTGSTVFQVAVACKAVTVVNTFDWSIGQNPIGLYTDASGNIYGVAQSGGSGGAGTIYQLALASAVWSGGGANADWSTAGNWSGPGPQTGDLLAFGGTSRLSSTNDLPAGTQFSGITFNAGAGGFTIGGNSLDLAGGITNNSASTQTIDLPLVLAGTQTLDAAAGELDIGGNIGQTGGPGGIVISGPGTVLFFGDNGYTGGTTVSSGTLIVSGAKGLPGGTSLVVGAGGAFIFDPTASASASIGLAIGATISPAMAVGAGEDLASAGASSSVSSSAPRTASSRPSAIASVPFSFAASGPAVEKATITPVTKMIDTNPKRKREILAYASGWCEDLPCRGNSVASPAAAVVHDTALQAEIVSQRLARPIWLADSWNTFVSGGQDDRRTRSLQAWDLVLAGYSQP